MAENLSEAYSEWLGIPPEEQPANYYRLLELPLCEADPAVIDRAASRRIEQVEAHRAANPSLAEQLLRELAAARKCLLHPPDKAAYDGHLKRALGEAQKLWTAEYMALEGARVPLGRYTLGTLRYLVLVLRRGWVRRLRLPATFRQFGQALYHEGRCREQFQRIFEQLDGTTESLRAVYRRRQRQSAEPAAWWQWPWRLAVGLWLWLRHTWLRGRRNSLFGRLGKRAYAVECVWTGMEELVEPVRKTLRRLEYLDARIEQLSQVPPGRSVSPKRSAQLVLALVFLGFLFFSGLLGWLLSWVF